MTYRINEATIFLSFLICQTLIEALAVARMRKRLSVGKWYPQLHGLTQNCTRQIIWERTI